MNVVLSYVLMGASAYAGIVVARWQTQHHSSVCHQCGGRGYVNGGICPSCCGDGKYHAGADPHEHHYNFDADDEAIDTEPNSCDTSNREFND